MVSNIRLYTKYDIITKLLTLARISQTGTGTRMKFAFFFFFCLVNLFRIEYLQTVPTSTTQNPVQYGYYT